MAAACASQALCSPSSLELFPSSVSLSLMSQVQRVELIIFINPQLNELISALFFLSQHTAMFQKRRKRGEVGGNQRNYTGTLPGPERHESGDKGFTAHSAQYRKTETGISKEQTCPRSWKSVQPPHIRAEPSIFQPRNLAGVNKGIVRYQRPPKGFLTFSQKASLRTHSIQTKAAT